MSVQIALNFLREARSDEQIQDELRGIIASATSGKFEATNEQNISPLVALGARYGFRFDSQELQAAFRHDWQMRGIHFQSQKADLL